MAIGDFGYVFGPETYHQLMQDVLWPPGGSPQGSVLGLDFNGARVRVSKAFPLGYVCTRCNGTGEGEESTYCRACKGAGETVVDGLAYNDAWQIMQITRPLPRKFDPRCTFAVPPRKLSCGLV